MADDFSSECSKYGWGQEVGDPSLKTPNEGSGEKLLKKSFRFCKMNWTN